MLKLNFVRHGETLSNVWETLQGWSDTPLTKKGIEQGKWLGIGLKDIPILKIYTSTSERAYDTADYLRGDRDLEIIMCRGLKEMNFGLLETKPNVFEGCTTYEERLFYPYDKYDGENFEMVYQRLKKTINEIVEENKDLDGNIVCVSHGISILAAIKAASIEEYEKQFKNKGFGNCSVTILTYSNNKFSVELVNSLEFVEKGRLYEEINK